MARVTPAGRGSGGAGGGTEGRWVKQQGGEWGVFWGRGVEEGEEGQNESLRVTEWRWEGSVGARVSKGKAESS